MSLLSRLKRLEKSPAAARCSGCEGRRITHHERYTLPNGETITLPPIPARLPCTCGRWKKEGRISFIICVRPGRPASCPNATIDPPSPARKTGQTRDDAHRAAM
jgi:hypothetical protein